MKKILLGLVLSTITFYTYAANLQAPETKFKFRDKVKIITGFYKGTVGIIIAHNDCRPTANDNMLNCYSILTNSLYGKRYLISDFIYEHYIILINKEK